MVHLRIGAEEQLLSWEELEARVAQGRVPPDAWIKAPGLTGDAWRRADTIEWIAALEASRASAFRRARAVAGPPLVTALLVGVQIRLWWWGRVPEIGAWLSTQTTKWGPPVLEDGEVLRLLTMGFVHAGLAHALLNLTWLAYVGFHLEQALGGRWLAVLYGASVLGGSLASLAALPHTPSLGASGGVFGLIAAAVVFGLTRPELLPERLTRVFGFALLPYLLLMFVSGLLNPEVDNWCHAGGLVVGGLLATVADPPGFERRPGWSARWQVATTVGAAALLLLLFAAGPRLSPLVPEAEARAVLSRDPAAALRAVQAEGPLGVRVPTGWKFQKDRLGGLGWVTPLGGRSFTVTQETLPGPLDPEGLRAWQAERLAARGVTGLTWTDGATLGPQTALGAEGTLPGDRPAWVSTRVLARGLQAVTATFVTEASTASRLAPLRDRLFAALTWSEVQEVVDARALLARPASSREARRRAAETLARWGEPDPALTALRALVADPGATSADWQVLLRVTRWYAPSVPDATAVAGAAFAAGAGGKVDAAVAELLDALDAPRTGDAVVMLGLAGAPGERSLLRAAESRGLAVSVDADGTLSGATVDALGGAAALRDLPRSLEAARALAARLGPPPTDAGH